MKAEESHMSTSPITVFRGGAGTVALALAAAMVLSACSSGGGGEATSATEGSSAATTAEGEAPADGVGVDDGTELTMWTRAPLERQAKLLVEAYTGSHSNQVKLEIVPNDDMEGKVGAAAQNGDLPDLLAGDVVRLPYWVDNGLFTDLTSQIEGLSNYNDIAVGHIDAGRSTSQTRAVTSSECGASSHSTDESSPGLWVTFRRM